MRIVKCKDKRIKMHNRKNMEMHRCDTVQICKIKTRNLICENENAGT